MICNIVTSVSLMISFVIINQVSVFNPSNLWGLKWSISTTLKKRNFYATDS